MPRQGTGFSACAAEAVDFLLRVDPARATDSGIHDLDDRFRQFTPQAMAQDAARARRLGTGLRAFEGAGLTPDEETDRLMLMAALSGCVSGVETLRPWRRDPSMYLNVAVWGCYLLFCRDKTPLGERMVSLAARLSAIPQLLDQSRLCLDEAAPLLVEYALDSLDGCADFLRQAVPAVASAHPDLEGGLLSANDAALRAFEGYRDFLRELKTRATGSFPVGAGAYEHLLRRVLLLGYGADETIAAGYRCLDETEAELERLAATAGGGRGWQKILEDLCQEDPGPTDGPALVAAYSAELARLRDFIAARGLAPVPPAETLRVEETPVFERPLIHLAAYLPPPPFETGQPGLFWLTPPPPGHPPGMHNRGSLIVTAVHEAYPGHHTQLMCAGEHMRPARFAAENTPYIEGWAFYCEELLERAGYATDVAARAWRLRDQLWRGARAVVDPSLHLGRMTFEQAVEFLQRRGRLTPTAARAEALHMAGEPGQSVCYLMGKLQVEELAYAHVKRFGAASLGDFHARLLALGSVPPQLAGRLLLSGDDRA